LALGANLAEVGLASASHPARLGSTDADWLPARLPACPPARDLDLFAAPVPTPGGTGDLLVEVGRATLNKYRPSFDHSADAT
jgi:hypothetical protein